MEQDKIPTEIIEEVPPKSSKKTKTKYKEEIQEIKTITYQVVLDIDKDLDLLLICATLNIRGFKAYLEHGEIITCGVYSNRVNANKAKSNIEALGYKALIQEV